MYHIPLTIHCVSLYPILILLPPISPLLSNPPLYPVFSRILIYLSYSLAPLSPLILTPTPPVPRKCIRLSIIRKHWYISTGTECDLLYRY